MADFSLTPPPPAPPEEGRRLTRWDELEGRQIRMVIEFPESARRNDVDKVIVFEDDCWTTLYATVNGCCTDDGASIDLTLGYAGKTLSDFLSPQQMFEARMVSQAQFKFLTEQRDAKERQEREARAARLRAEADRLVGAPS